MAALLMPDLPVGPVRALFEGLHGLHHRAGWPSVREIARQVGCSRTTVSRAFSEPRVPRWGLLELIVETLGGEVECFHQLWLAASSGAADLAIFGVDDRDAGKSSGPVGFPPRQLPGAVSGFTGRAEELADLDRLLAADGGSSGVVISAVAGPAGVGKTALVLHWAHQVADRFPDGQLYVDLRGYDVDKPVRPGEALGGFLRALGVTADDIPVRAEERAAAYRTLLSGRRTLVVLDNASSVDQVRDLLPGSPGCVVVLTSRDTLAGLVARHGARRLDLDLLPPTDAAALLATLIGPRVAAEPAATAQLAALCAWLPLALRVAAELALARTSVPLSELVAELADRQGRLDLLSQGCDRRTAVRSVFSWSYAHLPVEAARAFRLVGLHPGPDLDTYAAAALTGTTLQDARTLLETLSRAHLIHRTNPGRYGMHDLLHAYASGIAHSQDTAEDRQAALTRLLDHYLAGAAAAVDLLHPAGQDERPRISRPATLLPPMTNPTAAAAWLDAERATLIAACALAAGGSPSHATRLAATLSDYTGYRGYLTDAHTIHTHAHHAAGQTGDLSAEAVSLLELGNTCGAQGDHELAADHLDSALTLYRRLGDVLGQADALTGLAYIHSAQGRHPQAADLLQQALDTYTDLGDHTRQACALSGLSGVCWAQGQFHDGVHHLEQALALYRQIGDRAAEAAALANLGELHRAQGNNPQAIECLQQSLALAQELRLQLLQAMALDLLGCIYLRQGHYPRASDHLHQALVLCQDIGYPTAEAHILKGLGDLHRVQGNHDRAVNHHQQSITRYREANDRLGEAHALTALGLDYTQQGHHDLAIEHHHQALTRYRELGNPAAEATALNGLGEALQASGHPEPARTHHTNAHDLAHQAHTRHEQGRALNGIGHTYHATDNPDQARHHWQQALAIYTELDYPESNQIRERLNPTTTTEPTQHRTAANSAGLFPRA